MSKETSSIPRQAKSKLRRLTPKQKKFADNLIETGKKAESALKAYDIKSKNPFNVASAIASENLDKPSVQEYLANKAEDAATMVYKLSQTAKMEPVRLNASKDILDRAGYKPVEKRQNVNINVDLKEREHIESVTIKIVNELEQDEDEGYA